MIIQPKKMEKHGMTGTRIHNIWRGMRSRCYNPNVKCFKNYGGKGIRLCDEWNESFMSFYQWSIKNRYSDDLTIDRINVNESYSPSNCRWLDIKAQENNRSNNRLITFNGETHNMKEWGIIKGYRRGLIPSRIERGWEPARAVITPPRKGNYVHS